MPEAASQLDILTLIVAIVGVALALASLSSFAFDCRAAVRCGAGHPMGFAAILAVLVSLTLPLGALAAGTMAGAKHAVVHAMREEGDRVSQTRCRHTAPSRFGCNFYDATRRAPASATVTYTRRHYYVGEVRFHFPHITPLPAPCTVSNTC